MPSYPTTIPDVRSALLAYTPHPTKAEAIEAAQGVASPVVQIVNVFDALKSSVDVLEAPEEGEDPTLVLDADGLSLLAGCAHLISENAWHGKGPEAVPVLLASVAALG